MAIGNQPQESQGVSEPRRYAVWRPAPAFSGLKVKPEEQPLVDAVIKLFLANQGVIVQRRLPMSTRAI
jgi:hypothetical protein